MLFRLKHLMTFLFVLGTGASGLLMAQADSSQADSLTLQSFNTPSLTGHYIKLLLITFVLLVVFYFALRLMRKVQYGNQNLRSEPVRVLSKTYLTSKHSLWVVIIGKNKYLLGVTDQAINLLDHLGPASEQELASASMGPLPAFGNLFEKIRKSSR